MELGLCQVHAGLQGSNRAWPGFTPVQKGTSTSPFHRTVRVVCIPGVLELSLLPAPSWQLTQD